MKKLKKSAIVVCMLILFACNHGSNTNQSAKIQSTVQNGSIPEITVNGKKVSFTNVEESSLLSVVELKSTLDSIKYFKSDCQDIFCRLGNSKLYKLSKSGKFFLEYNPLTAKNTIINEFGKRIGTIKIKANNPEYRIETLPLENEPGLLYVDALSGVSKYIPFGKKLKLSWKIDWGKEYYMHSYHITKKELIVFRGNYNDKLANIDRYSLLTGNLINSRKMEYSVFETKCIYNEDLLLKYDKKNLTVYDLRNDNTEYTIPIKGIINLIDVTRNNGSIEGALIDSNKLLKFSIRNAKIITSRISLGDKTSCGKLIAVKNLIAIYYFQTNTPGVHSNNTKLLHQGIIFFNDSPEIVHMKHELVNDYLRIHAIDNSIFVNTYKKTFEIDLSKF